MALFTYYFQMWGQGFCVTSNSRRRRLFVLYVNFVLIFQKTQNSFSSSALLARHAKTVDPVVRQRLFYKTGCLFSMWVLSCAPLTAKQIRRLGGKERDESGEQRLEAEVAAR